MYDVHAMFSRTSRDKQERLLELGFESGGLIEGLHIVESPSSRVKAHHIEWVIAPDLSHQPWLEENKSPFAPC